MLILEFENVLFRLVRTWSVVRRRCPDFSDVLYLWIVRVSWLEMVYFEDISTVLCGLSKATP
jgi:hypothetical protein